MKTARFVLLAAALAMVAGVLPASAATPAACQGRAYPLDLAAGETLVERTFYFHGDAQLGNADAVNSPQALTMSEEAPTAEAHETKAFVSRPAALGNPSLQSNQYHGYFAGEFDSPSRLVCASIDFHAIGASSAIQVALFTDAGPPAGEFNATATSTGEGLRHYTGAFGNVEANTWDFLVQFNTTNPAGATILYDSADYPSSVTVVTVEKS